MCGSLRSLAERLNLVWEVLLFGTAMDQMLSWLNEIGYCISVRAVDCPIELALERANKRANDPNDSIHFHRDLSWRPRPFAEPQDVEEIRNLLS